MWSYLANLAYGVTTARDPSSSFDSFGYAEALETGKMNSPRLFRRSCRWIFEEVERCPGDRG